MALNDQRLNAKLREYLAKFGREWSFERLSRLGDAKHNEYEHDTEPTHPDFVQVHLQVLEHVVNARDNYFHVVVDISDNRRGFGKGSAFRSLCGGMLVHASGKVELIAPKGKANEV